MNEEPESVDPALRAPLAFAEKVARKRGYVLNPNRTQRLRLAGHLAENKAKHGAYYCPCKQHYPLRPGEDPVCPCKDCDGEVENQGHCECHLFYSEAAAKAARERPGLLADVACPG
jgi:ferredoxin-thioredoxin reductase catalytic subunit